VFVDVFLFLSVPCSWKVPGLISAIAHELCVVTVCPQAWSGSCPCFLRTYLALTGNCVKATAAKKERERKTSLVCRVLKQRTLCKTDKSAIHNKDNKLAWNRKTKIMDVKLRNTLICVVADHLICVYYLYLYYYLHNLSFTSMA